ncbi:MAG: 50S ribosomal protein L10 [Candidatus Omnitrophica bacterium]|nr:50S ribosomal protein L10 [Candidatus Omnitrophota bacterium]
MKKLGLLVKEISQSRITRDLKESDSVFIIKYSGLSSPDICSLRQSLRGANASLFVVRNNIAKRALKDSGFENLTQTIDGPCGFVFSKEEPVGVSKILYNFAKDHDKLKLEGGLLKDKVLATKDIEILAKLPAKEVLRAQAVVALKSPITGIVMVLNQTLRKFVYCLEQIKNKKSN